MNDSPFGSPFDSPFGSDATIAETFRMIRDHGFEFRLTLVSRDRGVLEVMAFDRTLRAQRVEVRWSDALGYHCTRAHVVDAISALINV